MIHPAPHIEHVKYAIRNIAAEAARLEAKGQRILYCNIGDPLRFDFQTPPHLLEAVSKAMRDGKNGYAPSLGIPQARAAVARSLNAQGHVRVTPDDVVLTAGASEAIDLTLTALLEPGDEVLLPSPGYPLYNAVAARLSAKVLSYQLDEARGWAIDVEELERLVTPKTRAVVICNPNNPTGALATKENLLALLAFARRHEIAVLSDEIYDKLIFDEPHVSTATLADDVPIITFNGMSKAYLACGWRVGWLSFGNPKLTAEVAAAVRRLADARLCGPAPVQYAVEPALFGPQDHIPAMMKKLRARRDLMVTALSAIPGVSVVTPKAAFYAMPKLELPGLESDEDFVLKLVRETGVLFVHGEGFGQKPGTHHVRVVYLPDEATLKDAFERFAAFVKRWPG
ncbi:MAG: aminotransferase class I/II-fold pyridoxal phosphate-dependent enzyme [Myxococcota bacterium]